MLRHRKFLVEHSAARDFFEQLRPPNEQVSRITTRIEDLDEQLEQLRIHHEQFEEPAAQAVRFDEADKLIERHTRSGGAREPPKQKWPQTAQDLTRARGDMKSARPLGQVGQRLCRRFSVTKNIQALD